MARFAIGDVVLTLFPFSNLKGQKLRPTLIVATAEFNNLVLCQITSKPYSSKIAIRLHPKDYATGSLPIISFVRPDKLFTAESSIIEKVAGKLHKYKRQMILKSMRKLFTEK